MQEKCQNSLRLVSSIYIYLMLSIFLLIMPPRFYVGITLTKYLFFAIATGSYVVIAVIVRFIFFFEGYNFQSSWKRTTPSQLVFMGFIIVMLLSCLLSPYRDQTFFGAGRYEGMLTGLLYLAAFYFLSRYGKLGRWHLITFAVTMMVVCILGIVQYYGSLIFYPSGSDYLSTSFLTTIGNVNMVSGVLCLAFPMFAIAVVRGESNFRWFYLIPLFLTTYLQCCMNVRSGVVGFLVVLVLMLPVMFRSLTNLKRATVVWTVLAAAALLQALQNMNEQGAKEIAPTFGVFLFLFVFCLTLSGVVWTIGKYFRVRKKRRAAAIAMGVILLLGLGVFAFNPTGQKNGLVYESSEVLQGNENDTFGSNRIFLWKRTLPLIFERPLLGSGADTFRWVFMAEYGDEVHSTINSYIYFDNAHNEYLQMGINYGIIGLLVYLIAVGCALFANWKKYDDPMLDMASYSVMCYLVQGFFSFSVPLVAPLFWMMLGICDSGTYDPQRAQAQLAPLVVEDPVKFIEEFIGE